MNKTGLTRAEWIARKRAILYSKPGYALAEEYWPRNENPHAHLNTPSLFGDNGRKKIAA